MFFAINLIPVQTFVSEPTTQSLLIHNDHSYSKSYANYQKIGQSGRRENCRDD
jgi:hypothetical protein